MATRIYRISDGIRSKLVRASSRAQAVGYVARSTYTSRVATQDDLVAHLEAGGKVEDAGASADEDGEQE